MDNNLFYPTVSIDAVEEIADFARVDASVAENNRDVFCASAINLASTDNADLNAVLDGWCAERLNLVLQFKPDGARRYTVAL